MRSGGRVTESRSDAPDGVDVPDGVAVPDRPDPDDLVTWAGQLAESLGAISHEVEHHTAQVYIDRDQWVTTITSARDEHGLNFFSWLTGVDWSKDVEVGEGVADVDSLDERFDVICRLSSVESSRGVHFVTALPKDDPSLASLVPVFAGAAWHEREASEMFGIDFVGHPGLDPLYLPDAFEGHPLRKSFPLLAREVKPWPGTVDVEAMPSTENVEADAVAASQEDTADASEDGSA